MTALPGDSARSHAEALIRAAFDQARLRGKNDWYRMTTAVLKNRILQNTANEFSVEAFGGGTVADFARQFPDLISVEDSSTGGPPIVTLLEAASASGAHDYSDGERRPAIRSQVREDLWRATMDWNESHVYVIDAVTGRARPLTEADPPVLPRIQGIAKDTYLKWRLDFIADALERHTDGVDQAALLNWRQSAGPSRSLPSHLQDEWMTLLRGRVVGHIRTWFEATGLPVPTDLTSEQRSTDTQRRAASSAPVEVAVATQQLRDVIRRCVDAMSYDELLKLQLPASVVARTMGR